MADLRVHIDFKSPYAYLALEPTRQLVSGLGLSVDWQPFVLDIPSYLGSARLNKRGEVAEQHRSASQWSGVKYAYYDCRRYANLCGMTIRGTEKIWDTNLAACGMLWAQRQGDAVLQAYLDAVYVPFWKRELDLEDLDAITAVLARAGAETRGFPDYARGEGRAENQRLQARSFASGVFGVPTFEVAGQRFFGREHLPRIRWLLRGEQGPAPDIALELLPGDQVTAATDRSLAVAIEPTAVESYLALEPICTIADELGIEPTWHRLTSAPPSRPPDPTDDSRGGRHRRYRADNLALDRSRYLPAGVKAEEVPARIEAFLRDRGITLADTMEGTNMSARGFLFVLGQILTLSIQPFAHMSLTWGKCTCRALIKRNTCHLIQ